MFDLTAGTIERPFTEAHPAATALSAVTHVIAIGAVVSTILFSVSEQLPEVPTIIAFVAEAPAPPPPPPPPPPAAKAAAAAPSKPAPATGPTFAAPAAIPDGIQPESGLDWRDEGGVVGGVEGGVPGGTLGGILGGMIDEAPPPPPRPPAQPRRVGGDLKAPALIHRVEPDYPGVAVSAKVSGMVILEAIVNESGVVTDVTVLRSIPLLDQAAIKAVKQWRYQPLMLNSHPTPFIVVVTLTFSFR
jgi:protein TonB